MIDLHLINVTLAGLGAGVGVVLLIAAAILAIAAFGRRGQVAHRGQPAPAGSRPVTVSTLQDNVREPALR